MRVDVAHRGSHGHRPRERKPGSVPRKGVVAWWHETYGQRELFAASEQRKYPTGALATREFSGLLERAPAGERDAHGLVTPKKLAKR
jgi:hypothetical protein